MEPNDPKWDARTLAEAKMIELDPARFQAAKEAAVVLASEKGKEKRALDSVAGKSVKEEKSNTVFAPENLL